MSVIHHAERFKDDGIPGFQKGSCDQEILTKRDRWKWVSQEEFSSIGSADVVERAKNSTPLWAHSLKFHWVQNTGFDSTFSSLQIVFHLSLLKRIRIGRRKHATANSRDASIREVSEKLIKPQLISWNRVLHEIDQIGVSR